MCCVNHADKTAEFACEWCGKNLCRDCVSITAIVGGEIISCGCGGRAAPLPARKRKEGIVPYDYLPPDEVSLKDGFSYAFRGNGPWVLGSTLGMLALMAIIYFPIWIIFGGYMLSYGKKMIVHSADGERNMPNWPDITNFVGDIFSSAIQWLFCLLICLGPMLFFLHSAHANLVLAVITGFLGALYLPICLLTVSMHDDFLAGLNFHINIPLIRKIGIEYVYVFLLMFAAIILSNLASILTYSLPLIGSLISNFITFYLSITIAHMLGLLYFKHDLDLF